MYNSTKMMVHDKVFELGESVEVSPDDNGFKGSWYEAIIINKIPKRANKNKPPKHYDVEYTTLLEDDESTPLTERIRADRVRPFSPQQRGGEGEHAFVLNDVVEAYHLDGWWVGVVTKVLELLQCGKLEVSFTDPPDQIQCGSEDLRLHLEWKNGVWLKPQEASRLEIEEKISEKKKGRKRKALEWCDHFGTHKSKNQRRDSVGSSLGDVNHDVASGKKDVGGYKEAQNNKKKMDGISLSNQQSTTNSSTGDRDSASRKRDTEGSKEIFHNKTIGIGEDANAHSATRSDDAGISPDQNIQGVACSVNEPKSLNSETLDRVVATAIIGMENGRNIINHNQEMRIVEQPEFIEKISKKTVNSDDDINIILNSDQETENVEQSAGVEGNHDEIINPVQEIVIVEQNENNVLCPNTEMEIMEQVAEQVVAVEGNTSKVINCNQEFNIVKETLAVEGNGNKLVTKQNRKLAIVDQNGSKFVNPDQELEVLGSNDQNLPFVKTSPLWNIIGSMSVFQAIPQKPHFRGLVDKYPVHCLEGKAIGYMLMYRDIVQKTAESRLTDEKVSISQRLATLSKLERNGFEVKGIRDRLTTLLERIDEHNTIQDQLTELNRKNRENVEVIEELNEKIKDLQEKCAEAISVREKTEREIAHFESKKLAICQCFNENVLEFEQLAAAQLDLD